MDQSRKVSRISGVVTAIAVQVLPEFRWCYDERLEIRRQPATPRVEELFIDVDAKHRQHVVHSRTGFLTSAL